MNQTNVTSQGLSPGASLRVLGVRSGQATDVGAPQTWAPRLLMARTRQIFQWICGIIKPHSRLTFCCVFDLQIFECHCVDSHFFGWLGNYPTLPLRHQPCLCTIRGCARWSTSRRKVGGPSMSNRKNQMKEIHPEN